MSGRERRLVATVGQEGKSGASFEDCVTVECEMLT